MRNVIEVLATDGTVLDRQAIEEEDRLDRIEARLDRAAAAQVTGDAAKLRDQMKPTG